MPIITSIFLVISLILAVLIGPQTRPWSWGPAMFALGISVMAALPVIWRRGKATADFWIIGMGLLTAMWFGWRAWTSPVAENGQADLLLLCVAIAAFISIRGIAGDARAECILTWGTAMLLLANLIIIGLQIEDQTYSPIFRNRGLPSMISGFFAHYSEAANYLIASSMLVGAAALFGRHTLPIRILWGLLALAGLAGVWLTTSRGGILGAALASGVFAAVFLIISKRRDSKWFAPMLIAIPVIGLAIGAFLYMGWMDAQEARPTSKSTVTNLLDNQYRLYVLGIAVSCISQHPMTGGGSRSFSTECYSFMDEKAQGNINTTRPEFVHNEFMQTATDYGLIGAGLLLALLGTFIVTVFVRALFEKSADTPDGRDAWRMGALAAFSGMFVLSCFSFVFHHLPGIILLGICLGQMTRSDTDIPKSKTLDTRILLSIAALICLACLMPAAWKGSQVTRILWSSYFSKHATPTTESNIDALTEAIRVWPQSEFHQERAALLYESMKSLQGNDLKDAEQRALADYQEAARLQPFDPINFINMADVSSRLQLDDAAEAAFTRAIQLQGGMEKSFHGNYLFSCHLYYKVLRLSQAEKPETLLFTLEKSATEFENLVKTGPYANDMRITIQEKLGSARQAAGNYGGAMECFNFAATLPGGTRANYLAGELLGKQAVAAWSKRRAGAALHLFMEAKNRVAQAGNQLPMGVTTSQRDEYLTYLDRTIAFLKGAKIEPEK